MILTYGVLEHGERCEDLEVRLQTEILNDISVSRHSKGKGCLFRKLMEMPL